MTTATTTHATPAAGAPGGPRLRGYRAGDLPLLTGSWLPGELLGLPVPGRPPLADPATVPPPASDRPGDELYVLPGTAFVRFTEVDWIHRRARLETGFAPGADAHVRALLDAALGHARGTLGLRRVYGWVTPGRPGAEDVLRAVGLAREARIPHALWLDGRPVGRQIWGMCSDD
ncbi:hypothetical protein FNQ90_18600 [Streptomyces alkaliphilus]|uniref:GNAT family N-acetyltransferase n=1 Tax=Streptomyces alkaliphilus TaxID=1472722 RepID=A0A7W3TGD4_9ACTN|nr:GNAT family protein [Streptomyces alkaliphilus]MBB0246060.1 hypothetical protein [Streptomyces alkaliphilus]